MKLIHLSDLHIGKRVHEMSLLEDQALILTQILSIIDEEKPAAVMICGDVYDKSIPSAEAVTLFDDFLCRLAKRSTKTLIISGNHDSPERLSFGNRLMEHAGIHICPVYNGKVEPITLEDGDGPVDFWLLPFIKPAHVRKHFPELTIESYTDAVRAAIQAMPLDKTRRNVLLTHQFVTGATPGGSEEQSVGGSDNVDASVFDGFDYVALGHIHGPQNIGTNRIRYCGTPLKYAFAEASHQKSISVVELDAGGALHLTLRPLTARHDMRIIRGTFQQLTDKAFYSGTATDDYLHAVLTDEEDINEAKNRLHTIYPNLMTLEYDNTRTRSSTVIGAALEVEQKTPLELFEEFYDKQNGQPMSDIQRNFVKELLEAIQEESL